MNLQRTDRQLYVQIFEDLLTKIKAGRYKQGEQLPTEQELEKYYNVSKAPVRQALGKLSDAGVIERKAGKGTFVTAIQPEKYPLLQMGGFVSQYIKNTGDIFCRTIQVSEIKADKKIHKVLQVPSGGSVIYIERIRYFEQLPVFYLQHYLIADAGVDVIRQAGDFVSLPDVLSERCNLHYWHVSEEIMVEAAAVPIAAKLEVACGVPVFFIKRTAYSEDFVPIYYTEYYVRQCDWSYKVNYTRDTVKD